MTFDFMEHLADDARRREIQQARENKLYADILDGGELHILGRRARLHIEWLDEAPPPEFLQQMAASLRKASGDG